MNRASASSGEEQQTDSGPRDDDGDSQDDDKLDLASLHSSDSMSVYTSSLSFVTFSSTLQFDNNVYTFIHHEGSKSTVKNKNRQTYST